MWKVWNFGKTKSIPWQGKFVYLPSNSRIQTENEELMNFLARLPMISVKRASHNLEDMRMADLYKLASERGIKDFFGRSKRKIIALLEEPQTEVEQDSTSEIESEHA